MLRHDAGYLQGRDVNSLNDVTLQVILSGITILGALVTHQEHVFKPNVFVTRLHTISPSSIHIGGDICVLIIGCFVENTVRLSLGAHRC